MLKNFCGGLLVFLCFGEYSLAHSHEGVAAVLSGDTPFYQEAFRGFQDVFQQTVVLIRLPGETRKIQPKIRVVVTFGSRAALDSYPEKSVLIYAMAPMVGKNLISHPGRAIKLAMTPTPPVLISKLQSIQPGMKRLAVLWTSPAFAGYIQELKAAAAPSSLAILPQHLKISDQLPDRLRQIAEMADALWTPPDPEILNPQNFSLIRDFSLSNRIPWYVPTEGLVEKGAVASVSVSFYETGCEAARLAVKLIEKGEDRQEVYPSRTRLVLNKSSAQKAGLVLLDQILKEADRVIP